MTKFPGTVISRQNMKWKYVEKVSKLYTAMNQ